MKIKKKFELPPPRDHVPFILSTPCGLSFRFPTKVSGRLLPYNPSDTPLARWAKNLHYTPQRSSPQAKMMEKTSKTHGKLSMSPALFFHSFHLMYSEKILAKVKIGGLIFGFFGSCPVFSLSQKKLSKHGFTAHLSHLRPFFDQFEKKKNSQEKRPGHPSSDIFSPVQR